MKNKIVIIKLIFLLSVIYAYALIGCTNTSQPSGQSEQIAERITEKTETVENAVSADNNEKTDIENNTESPENTDFTDTTESIENTHNTELSTQENHCEHIFCETAIIKPTCTEYGKTEKICKICGFSEITVIPYAEHSIVTDPPKEPTCTSFGLTEGIHCIICSVKITEQIVIPKLEHQYIKGICQICHRHKESIGLNYQKSESGEFYILTGRGNCTDEYIVIADSYNGLPVREIADRAVFRRHKNHQTNYTENNKTYRR